MLNILKKNKQNRGVTLMELLVVISIVAILSAVLIVNNNKYRSSQAIQNLADDIALSVRKAQGYAVGVHGDISNFDYGYGVHFSTNTPKSLTIFRDMNSNYNYDNVSSCGNPTSTNECMETLTINNASKIISIDAINSSGGSMSINSGGDVIFKRPNPEPIFCRNSAPVSGISYVMITVGDGYGVNKHIYIYNNGQISVN